MRRSKCPPPSKAAERLREYLDIFENTTIDGWFGVMPVYVPLAAAVTFGTVIGIVLEGPFWFFSPFFAMQVISIGFSIDVTVANDVYPVHVFDWAINAGFIGAIVYLG